MTETTRPAGPGRRQLSLRPPARGMAALTVVMVLFFVMAMVAAYTNRNLVFEQRIAANTYRTTKALDAADAGVEWAVAMLNGGRVGTDCQPSVNPADDDFRRRYLVDAPDDDKNGPGGYSLVWGGNRANQLYPACINRDGQLRCICPSVATPNPDIGAPADGVGSAYALSFLLPGNDIRQGTMQFVSRGCASLGNGDTACYAQSIATPQVDALSSALSAVGLLRALPLPPVAALTAGTTINAAAGELWLGNGDPTTGLTAHAGGAIQLGAGTNRFEGPAGSGSDGRSANDAQLLALAQAPVAEQRWFRSMFGMDTATFQRQPAVVRVNCQAGCTMADLNNTLLGYPRNPVWVNGNLVIDTPGPMGTDVNPLMLIVDGTLSVAADVDITGFVHATSISWSDAGASVKGAMVSATTFTTTARTTAVYDRTVMDLIQRRYGSFVRLPGSWNLTNAF